MEDQFCQKLINFRRIVARLREPGGCPWDQKQTPQTFKTYLIEEVYELAEAIEQDDPDEVRAELGDMLFQLLFINNLYQEQGQFTFSDVIDAISAKMIRRHPHVFGDTKVETLQELKDQWYSIKAKERKAEGSKSHQLHSLPKGLPALRRAHRVQERASKLGLAPLTQGALLGAMQEKLDAIRIASEDDEKDTGLQQLGELLLQAAELGRHLGGTAEESLQGATDSFIERFDRLEKLLEQRGLELGDLDPDQQRRLWQETRDRR